jgi:phosphoglycolate phosphatase
VRLILFDIDGTLVTTDGAGRRALARALSATFGSVGGLVEYDLRGKTDPRIVLDVMAAAGIGGDRVREALDACFEAYARALVDEIGDGARVTTLPGIAEVLRQLQAREDVVLGLVTGNIEEGARIKLTPPRLWPYFRTGAFGSDHEDRRRLPSLAARRAHALTGYPFRPERVVVVGDTPWDIDCARAFGARAVAVATGQYRNEELAREQPDHLLESCGDVDAALRVLLDDLPSTDRR